MAIAYTSNATFAPLAYSAYSSYPYASYPYASALSLSRSIPYAYQPAPIAYHAPLTYAAPITYRAAPVAYAAPLPAPVVAPIAGTFLEIYKMMTRYIQNAN